MHDRSTQLKHLTDSLAQLCAVLALDTACQWQRHFATCLQQARELGGSPLEQSTLNALSARVMSVYGGMGSFNDYVPWHDGRLMAGMQDLDHLTGQVHAAALALRVVAGPLHGEPLV